MKAKVKIILSAIYFFTSIPVYAGCKEDVYNLQLRVKQHLENQQWSSACIVGRDSVEKSNKCDMSYDTKTQLQALVFDICNKAQKLGNQERKIAY